MTKAAPETHAKPINLRIREDIRMLIDRAAKIRGKTAQSTPSTPLTDALISASGERSHGGCDTAESSFAPLCG